MAKNMHAARLHNIGEPFQVDPIPIPEVRPTDVLVEVKAAGVVPNLRNVVTNYPNLMPLQVGRPSHCSGSKQSGLKIQCHL